MPIIELIETTRKHDTCSNYQITKNRIFFIAIPVFEIEQRSELKNKNYHKTLLPHKLTLTLTHKYIRTQTYNQAVLEQLRNPDSNSCNQFHYR